MIIPPRPKKKITPDLLGCLSGEWIGQAKMNGSYCVIDNGKFYNRHGDKFQIEPDIQINIQGTVLCGEYMNKCRDYNGMFIAFDILKYNGKPLIGKTYNYRYKILSDLLIGTNEEYGNDLFLDTNYLDVGLIRGYSNAITDFIALFVSLSKLGDYCEGMVIKKGDETLKDLGSESSNSHWQLKCRKEKSKTYIF